MLDKKCLPKYAGPNTVCLPKLWTVEGQLLLISGCGVRGVKGGERLKRGERGERDEKGVRGVKGG